MINLLKNISLFLLVFSLINDNFLVASPAGGNSLKAIFAFFLLMNIREIIQGFLQPKNTTIKFFYLFFFSLAAIAFTDVIFGYVPLIQALFILVGIFVVFVYVSYNQSFEKLLYFIWISMVFSAILAVFSDPITPWTFRKTGGTGDPNEFATQLLATMAITVYLFTKNKNIFFLLSSMVLFFYTLLYAGSKSSLLTLAALILFILVAKFSDLLKKLFSFKTFLLILIVGVGLSFSNIGQMKAVKGIQERAQSAGTAKTRFVSWNAGVRMAEDNLFTGVGIEQYEKNVKRYATDFIAKGSYAPHNFLIKILGEAGFFPFITMILFLIVLFGSEYKRIVHTDYFWIYIAALSVVLMGLTLSIAYEKYFWLFLGLLSHINLVLFIEEKKEDFYYEDHAYST
jgi:O-antigen ligase